MEKMEQIGKITLDYTFYPGEDFYCDGEVEDKMLELSKKYAAVEFPAIIEEEKSWPVLYHFSAQRENIVSWLPIDKSMKVLEIGSGCGAITGVLSAKAGSVTCVDLSRKRSLINAYRHDDCDNVTIKVGNFQDIEPSLDTDYDYALLIGVFEYGQSYIGGETPFEDFLKIIRKHVKADGNIVIAIENKAGLKYWAGCREDHLGTFFSGIEGYPEGGGVRTFTRQGLERIFKACEEKKYHFYYPYPDYKFMTTLYSDKRLPAKGELYNNYRNFDRDRMLLFDERKAFDGIIEDGMFPYFSNSYLVVLGNKPATEYIRYSNDRAPEYQIATEILLKDEDRLVKKRALSKESYEHVNHMAQMYERLEERYDKKELSVNPVRSKEMGCVTFPFEKGVMLSTLFDEYLDKDDIEGFQELFFEYVRRIDYHAEMKVADFDLVFSNILVEKNNWTIIDYEWTEETQIATKEIAFRALYCYIMEDERRNKFNFDLIIEKLGITEQEAQEYREKELQFQKKVTGKRMSMPQLRDLIGGAMITPQKNLEKQSRKDTASKVQIYFDRGNGFSEEDSFFVQDIYNEEGHMVIELDVDADVKMMRLDPYMDSCVTTIEDFSLNGEGVALVYGKRADGNGKYIPGEGSTSFTMMFGSTDPGITIKLSDLVKSTGNRVQIILKTVAIPSDMATIMEQELRKKIRL